MGLTAKQVGQLTKIMLGLYKLFNEKDLALVELNPLAILTDGNLVALDGKINFDDNAMFRHPELAAMRDITQEDATEVLAVASTTSTTSRSTATSAAWSTAPAWRWRRWT